MSERYMIGYDIGTGGCKTVLATPDGDIVDTDFGEYPVCYTGENCAEQEPEDWWRAATATTRRLIERTGTDPADVMGIAFTSQMLGVLPMSREGVPLCRGIIWMDSRAQRQARRMVRRMGGERVLINLVGVVPSGKDVACKLKWFEEEASDIFDRAEVFLDVKGYMLYRATGRFVTDQTAASVTGYMDKKTRGWSPSMARILGGSRSLAKMPPVNRSTDIAGGLTGKAADELGLCPGTPVATGMGDAPAAMIGGGALGHGECVISIGTSGLLLVHSTKSVNLGKFGMASIAAADPSMWLVTAELITAGGCLKWFSEQLVTPEEHERARDRGGIYAELDRAVVKVPPGARRLIFTPWMFGERAPVTDVTLRGGFVNLGIEHTRDDMLRAIYEGVAMNFRWCFEAAATKGLPCPRVRAIGGGALSDAWMQVFADVTGRTIEPVVGAQEAGALGAALVVPVALGRFEDYEAVKKAVKVRGTFQPDVGNREIYDKLFQQFKHICAGLAPVYHSLNG
jgi:xylulokinase